jgi:beta-1,4-N-acetylglucosaminyltransferase
LEGSTVIFFFCFVWCSAFFAALFSTEAHRKKQLDNSEDVGQKMKKKKKSVFVTVGTTSFDALVEAMDSEELIQTLIERGYDSLTIQRGRGTYVPKHIVTSTSSERSSAIKVQVVEFLPSLDAILKEASLVISHAGAGSVFESLSLGKPTLVVVNESLMDNHQVELAETLASLGHVAWTKPDGLLQALNAFDPNSLVKYESGECTLAKDIEDFVFL